MPTFLQDKTLAWILAGLALLVAAYLILMIVKLVFGLRRLPRGARGRQQRLGFVETFALDGERQLVLVRRDNIEHLVMIGGPNDVLIESSIVRVEPRENRPPREKEPPVLTSAGAAAPVPTLAPAPPAANPPAVAPAPAAPYPSAPYPNTPAPSAPYPSAPAPAPAAPPSFTARPQPKFGSTAPDSVEGRPTSRVPPPPAASRFSARPPLPRGNAPSADAPSTLVEGEKPRFVMPTFVKRNPVENPPDNPSHPNETSPVKPADPLDTLEEEMAKLLGRPGPK